MADYLHWLYRTRHSRMLVGGLVVAGLLVTAGAFVVDTDTAQPDPVSFDQTKSFKVAAEERVALEERNVSIPRVQIFYSQYPYVVGYHGVKQAVETLDQPTHGQQFGRPLTVYVADYAGTGLWLTTDGYLRSQREPNWVGAGEAWFVVGSEARTVGGQAVVPFGTRDAADAFSRDNGGTVVTWEQLDEYSFDLDTAGTVRQRVETDRASADRTVAEVQPLHERPETVVVGTDAPTIQAAVDSAPQNSTVVVPPGTYDEHVTIDRPVTVRGYDATIHGNWTTTVLRVQHDSVALTGLRITGVGPKNRPADAFEGDQSQWDARIDDAYGRSDAAIRVNASRVSVRDVVVETPTTGILIRDSTDVVVDNVTVVGSDRPMAGFMGVLSIRSPVVVQESTIDGGRDGIYLHRAHGSVLRNNTLYGQRFGVHFMYTSESLITGNTARNQTLGGVVIMTSPARNAVVGNDIRDAENGIILSGTRSYVAENVVADNTKRGIQIGTDRSVYERNVIYGNDVGIRVDSLLPSNEISQNDFVANDRHALAGLGPLRVWTEGETGNYWEGAHGFSTGPTLDRSYSPTSPTEREFGQTDGAVTLGESLAAKSLAAIRGQSPGLRQGEILDTSPLSSPVRPDVVTAVSKRESLGPGAAPERFTARSDDPNGGERGE